MKRIITIAVLLCSAFAFAGCAVEVDYVTAINDGLHLWEVPQADRTYNVYMAWVAMDTFNFEIVPKDIIDTAMAGIALDGADPNTVGLVVHGLEYFDPALFSVHAERMVEKYPGLLHYAPKYLWTAERLERALRQTPHWGLLAASGAKCNLVHDVPLEAWRVAVEGAPSDLNWLPNHIAAQLEL